MFCNLIKSHTQTSVDQGLPRVKQAAEKTYWFHATGKSSKNNLKILKLPEDKLVADMPITVDEKWQKCGHPLKIGGSLILRVDTGETLDYVTKGLVWMWWIQCS